MVMKSTLQLSLKGFSMSGQSGIYCIEFLPTQQKYIGSTKKFSTRFAGHRSDLKRGEHHSYKLQKLWNENKRDEDLSFVILETVEDLDKLMEREQFWLDFIKPELNVIDKAHRLKPESLVSPWLGKHRPEDTKEKISQSLTGRKGRVVSEETREKLRIANTGKKISEATRQKLRDSHKGQVVSDETRAKQSEARKGKSHAPTSEATKEKIRKSVKALWDDPDYVAKHHEALSEVMGSTEMRERLSKAHKGKKLSKVHKQKIGNAHLGMKRSPETKKRLSAARKLWWSKRKKK